MKFCNIAVWSGVGLLLFSLHSAADPEAPEVDTQREAEMREAYAVAMEAAEAQREEAMAAVERARAEMERSAEERAKRALEAAQAREEASDYELQRRQEVEAMRSELSRAQEELRRASREVVRVHRELERGPGRAPMADAVRFSNKAVIGVILGDSNQDGVEILGVSPDGPAERAGLKQGDVIVSVMGKRLASDADGPASKVLLEVMREVKPGDELDITVLRDGSEQLMTVTAKQREPVSWTSLIRLPSVPDAPDAPIIIKETIEVPRIDEKALAEKMEQLQDELRHREIIISKGAHGMSALAPEGWEFEYENFSELGENILHSANVWIGMPMARGLKFAEVNEQLGDYFKTDYGVLVLNASEDNDLQLLAGDVILAVGGNRVEKPADVMRELRNLEPGSTLEVEVMRKRKQRTLDVVVPEPEHSLGFAPEAEHSYHYEVEVTTD